MSSTHMRAGPVIGPERRMDSNIAARRGVHLFLGSGSGDLGKVDRDAGSSKVRSLVSAVRVSVGALMMSMIRDVKVAWRFVRPSQTMIVTRSENVQCAII